MINLREQMGERIKKRRKQMYLTQDKLAEQAGLTTQTISSAEGCDRRRKASKVY